LGLYDFPAREIGGEQAFEELAVVWDLQMKQFVDDGEGLKVFGFKQ